MPLSIHARRSTAEALLQASGSVDFRWAVSWSESSPLNAAIYLFLSAQVGMGTNQRIRRQRGGASWGEGEEARCARAPTLRTQWRRLLGNYASLITRYWKLKSVKWSDRRLLYCLEWSVAELTAVSDGCLWAQEDLRTNWCHGPTKQRWIRTDRQYNEDSQKPDSRRTCMNRDNHIETKQLQPGRYCRLQCSTHSDTVGLRCRQMAVKFSCPSSAGRPGPSWSRSSLDRHQPNNQIYFWQQFVLSA